MDYNMLEALEAPADSLDISQVTIPGDIPLYTDNKNYFQLDNEETDYSNIDVSVEPKQVMEAILLADPQFGVLHDNESWTEERDHLKKGIEIINKNKKENSICLVLGDLANVYVDAEGKERLRHEQLSDMLTELNKIEIPLLLMPGNHDIGNDPTPEKVESYCDNFGSTYYAFVFMGVAFIVANSSYIVAPDSMPEETKKQEKWLDTVLKRANDIKCRQIFFLCHHPLFFSKAREADLRDDDTIHITPLDAIVPKNLFQMPRSVRMPLLKKLNKFNVSHSFHGHTHWNKIVTDQPHTQVVTASIGTAVCGSSAGFQVVSLNDKDDEVFLKFVIVETE